MKRIALFFFIINSSLLNLSAQKLTETSIPIDYLIRDSVDMFGNQYICYWGQLPSVFTFVNNDGSVTICASSEDEITRYDNGAITTSIVINPSGESVRKTYIYEYDSNLKEQKTFQFQNELKQLGAFTKDNDGNYYFFYAEAAADRKHENMAVVKYNSKGEKINTYKQNADPPDNFGGIKIPFEAGTCKLELSASMLAVYFSRKRFDGHQASYGFVINKDTFERIDKGNCYYYTNGGYPKGNYLLPFAGHSFNQFILPVDNGFVFADHGDAYPRAFTFGKFQSGMNTVRLDAFKFPGSTGANATYAEMGGLSKTSSGYIFAGVYGKDRNNSRNVFVLTFDDALASCSAPIYLTKYTKTDGHAGHPKIVKVDANRYMLLWEFFSFSTQSANLIINDITTDYLSTYMLLIDEKGAALSEPRELKGIRLNMGDTLRYNPHNGKVYWAINDYTSIKIYALEKNVE
ncbi:MAG: hypothetical protein LBU85_01855 [Treponema sp.]|jgi:hypothetical protein|nr:hypothetical protein [Treponema sp.]